MAPGECAVRFKRFDTYRAYAERAWLLRVAAAAERPGLARPGAPERQRGRGAPVQRGRQQRRRLRGQRTRRRARQQDLRGAEHLGSRQCDGAGRVHCLASLAWHGLGHALACAHSGERHRFMHGWRAGSCSSCMHASAQATLARTPAAQHAGAVIPPLVTLCHERRHLRKRMCTAAACTVGVTVGVSVLSLPLFADGRASSNEYARPSADGAPSRARRTAPPQPPRSSAAAARTPTKCGGGAGASRQTTRRPPCGPPHAAQTGAAGPRRMPASSSPHFTAGRPAGSLPQAPAHAAGAAPALLSLPTVATSARASAHGHACFAVAPAAGTAGARAGKHSAGAALAASRRPSAGRRRGGESEIGEQLHSGAMPPAPARTPASEHCAGRLWTVWLRAPAPGASHGTTCVLQTGVLRHARPVRRARSWPAEASAS